MDLSAYARWDLVAMGLALTVVFGFEMLGVFTDRYVTITAIVRHAIPTWARAMILGWLCWHFLIK